MNMRSCYFTILLFICFGLQLNAQFKISGKVTNERGEELELATVFVDRSSEYGTITDANGNYTLELPEGEYILKCSYVGYLSVVQDIYVVSDMGVDFEMSGSIYGLDTIEIISNRVNSDPVFSYANMDRDDIDIQNMGKDMPYVMQMTPSVVVTSDAGTGIGYTGIRVRGSDATRVNVTINGVALNDAESQGVFWVDLPDFASSVDNIQIQRGVGPSTNGAGSFGATVSLNTLRTDVAPGITLDGTIGSFGTNKYTVGLSSGLINDMYAVDFRYSGINSDGYIDRATSELTSYYFSAGRISDKSSFKFITFSGSERTYQSWYGTPEAKLYGTQEDLLDHYNRSGLYETTADSINLFDSDRTFNYYTYDDQVDDYTQDHYQIHYSRLVSDNYTTNVTGFFTRGLGFFEQYKYDEDLSDYLIQPIEIEGETITRTDIVRRRWLDNKYFGLNWNNKYKVSDALDLDFGLAASRYNGKHYGNVGAYPLLDEEVVKPNVQKRYYFSDGHKNDFNMYAKANFAISDQLTAYGDLQYRKVNYQTAGTDNDLQEIDVDANFDFFNPKVGLNYKINDYSSLYTSFAVANREPDRNDFTDNITDDIPSHETLYDTELGYRRAGKSYALNINGYYMLYDNQLVVNGQLNDVGSNLRTNVKESYRLGLETAIGIQVMDKLRWDGNVTLSRNKIADFTEILYDYTNGFDIIENQFKDTDIAFSPNVVAANMITYEVVDDLSAIFSSKYVGDQFLDNTSNDQRMIPSYFVNDLGLTYTRDILGAKADIQLMVYNLFNELYVSNGYTYSYIFGETVTENFYYPQAERHFMVRVKLDL